jgi:hypothetical protein
MRKTSHVVKLVRAKTALAIPWGMDLAGTDTDNLAWADRRLLLGKISQSRWKWLVVLGVIVAMAIASKANEGGVGEVVEDVCLIVL